MEFKEAIKTGKELAEYFVYCCGEGEDYVSLIERLRDAKNRTTLAKAVYSLLRYGHLHLKENMKNMNKERLDALFDFISTGEIFEVRRFYSSLVTYISVFEFDNIRKKQTYLMELLNQK